MHKAFEKLYLSKKRYFLLTGGRGSLKTSNVHEFVIRLTYEAKHGILFTRFTMRSAETSIIPEFKIVLDRLGATNDFKITKTKVINIHTGSFIYFSGIKTSSGDQTAKLKSIAGVTTWVIEEGEDFKDEKTFEDIDDSIRTTDRQNRIIWIQNPTTREHFIFKKWFKNSIKKEIEGFDVSMSSHPDVEHIHTTYHIAEREGYLNQDWIKKTKGLFDKVQDRINKIRANWKESPEKLKAEIYKIWHTSYYYFNRIGGWKERAEGVVFENWKEGEFDESLPHCYGLDYGLYPDPLAMCKIAVDQKNMKIYLQEIIYKQDVIDIAKEFEKCGVNHRDLIICDTNENRTTLSLRKGDRAKGKKGYNTQKAIKGKGSVSQGIREIKNYTIVVTPNSQNAKTELNNYVWNDKKASIPIDDYNHLMDAMRYAFRRLTLKKGKGVRQVY